MASRESLGLRWTLTSLESADAAVGTSSDCSLRLLRQANDIMIMTTKLTPNKIAAGNRYRAFSFDGTMKFEHHHCSQAQSPVAVPELDR